MLGERLTGDRAEAGDQVEDPGRQTGRLCGLGEELGGERGVLGRLEDHRAAGGERGGDLGDDLVERVVPGGDRADDPDRLHEDGGVADPLLEGVRRGQFGVRGGDQDRHGGVDHLRERQRRAQLGRDRLGQLVLAGGQCVAQGGEPGGALGGRGGGPAGERGAGGLHRRVDVLGRSRRYMADELLVGRVHDRDRVLAGGGPPRAADVHLVMGLHGCFLPDGLCGAPT